MSAAARAAAALAGLALVVTACTGAREPVPPAIDRYFEALRDGDLAEAYDLTTLGRYQPVAGFALSREHFERFHEVNPLESYRVIEVFRQEIRETLGSEGRPFFTVDVDLVYPFGTSRQSVYLEGEVLPRVEIEPAAILLAAGPGFPDEVLVDGVPTPVNAGGENVALTVLAGEHDLTVNGTEVRIATTPLAVVEGPAVLDEGPPARVRFTS